MALSEAQEITRKAKSNLAFALLSLPKENRKDVTLFYAFCRIIDDIADDPEFAKEEKEQRLAHWQQIFESPPSKLESIEASLLQLCEKHQIDKTLFLDLIEGCRMDLAPQRFQTWPDLQKYTHRVASTVGLICLPLFGATNPKSQVYATKLGHALQLTNILRDVGEDLDNGGRIYLPLEDLSQFKYSETDLLARTYDERFVEMMSYQARRTTHLFQEAVDCLPQDDRQALMAAEIMRSLYERLLEKMEDDKFQVFQHRYRLSKGRKLATLVMSGLRVRFSDS